MSTSLTILTFHAVDNRPSVIAFPPKLFQRSMARLHDRGYQTLSLPELIDCLQRGVPFPERSLAITFDDGYQSVYEQAFPSLQRYGFTATVFLTVGAKGNGTKAERLPSMSGRSMLSWSEIKEMYRWGITFGAHTLTHPDLTTLPLKKVEIEINDSKAAIEDALDTPVACFAYPYGRYDTRCREIVSHHFVCACSDKLGLVRPDSDVYAMERVDAYYLRTDRLFAAMSTRLFPLYIRARAVPRQLGRALQGCISHKF